HDARYEPANCGTASTDLPARARRTNAGSAPGSIIAAIIETKRRRRTGTSRGSSRRPCPFSASAEPRRPTPPLRARASRSARQRSRLSSYPSCGSPLLRAKLPGEGRDIALEAQLPVIRSGLDTGQAVETLLPAGGVAGRRVRRQLVDQDQAGPVPLGRELEPQ